MPEFVPTSLLPALLALPAGDVVPALRRLLAAQIGAADVLVHLVNYRKTRLRELSPAATGGPGGAGVHRNQPVDGSPTGTVFTSQLPQLQQSRGQRVVHAPLTVRGQRLGVLTVTLPAGAHPGPGDGPAAAGGDTATTVVVEVAAVLAVALHVSAEGSDVMELARRGGRLSVAAEMQWQLLPGTALAGPGFLVAGHLEPARRVGGDAFDWAHNGQDLWLTVADADGDADRASLASTLAVSALRNARRGGLPLARQAVLANEAVRGEFHGERTVSVLLVHLDLAGGAAQALCAGPLTLLRMSDGNVHNAPLQTQPQLGGDGDWDYQPQRLTLDPGERLLACTGGAVSAASPSRLPFGVDGLARVLRSTSAVSPQEVVRLLVGELLEHSAGELEDDASAVCLDWQHDLPG